MALSARLRTGDLNAALAEYYRFAEQRMERAALIATDRGATEGKGDLRTAFQAARLGGLGNAIDATSDLKKGNGVHRLAGGGFRASGIVFLRSRSERTLGAIEAYTVGADIRPRRGRWLWFPTDEIQRMVGSGKSRKRLEPRLWKESGLEARIGPLVFIQPRGGNPLLVVKDVGVPASGIKGKPRAHTKRGLPRKGRVAASIIAFVGIPNTSRAARVDVQAILRVTQGQLINYFYQATGRI